MFGGCGNPHVASGVRSHSLPCVYVSGGGLEFEVETMGASVFLCGCGRGRDSHSTGFAL